MSSRHLVHIVLALAEGRADIGLILLAAIALFWVVVALAAYMMLFRAVTRARRDYRAARARLYAPAVEAALMEEPYERVRDLLRPRRLGDLEIAQETVVEPMRHLVGAPHDLLRRAAEEHGMVAHDLRALCSWNEHHRGRALDALGAMKIARARDAVAACLRRPGETLEIKLVALRTLAALGDPASLADFHEQADLLPQPLLPRLASLALEFDRPGAAAAARIITRHPKPFPPAALAEFLQRVAAVLEPTR